MHKPLILKCGCCWSDDFFQNQELSTCFFSCRYHWSLWPHHPVSRRNDLCCQRDGETQDDNTTANRRSHHIKVTNISSKPLVDIKPYRLLLKIHLFFHHVKTFSTFNVASNMNNSIGKQTLFRKEINNIDKLHTSQRWGLHTHKNQEIGSSNCIIKKNSPFELSDK